MFRTIWKFRLEITDEQVVDLPLGAELLSVGMQGQDLNLWALVNPDQPAAPRRFRIVGTGNPADGDLGRFVGTVQQDAVLACLPLASMVWHVFEGGS